MKAKADAAIFTGGQESAADFKSVAQPPHLPALCSHCIPVPKGTCASLSTSHQKTLRGTQ